MCARDRLARTKALKVGGLGIEPGVDLHRFLLGGGLRGTGLFIQNGGK